MIDEEKEQTLTVGIVFPGAGFAYAAGRNFPMLQLGRIKRHFNWGIAEEAPFVVTLPYLVLHCSMEFHVQSVQDENKYLKRRCIVLKVEHEVLKKKHAKLENDVEYLKRLVTQLLASSSPGLTIADQGRESTASDAGGAFDPKGKGKAKM